MLTVIVFWTARKLFNLLLTHQALYIKMILEENKCKKQPFDYKQVSINISMRFIMNATTFCMSAYFPFY